MAQINDSTGKARFLTAKGNIRKLIAGEHPISGKPLKDPADSALILVRASLQALLQQKERPFRKNFSEEKKTPESASEENKLKKWTLEEKRKKHRNAYASWSKEDDELLETLFCEGKSINELTQKFERQRGAIESRIRKLELKEKYGEA